MIYKKWTRKDIIYLKANYGKISAKEIAKDLDTTKGAITNYAQKLGLKSNLQIASYGMKGKHHSNKAKEKIGLAGLNRECSETTRKKMSAKKQNEKHPAWKDDKVGYFSLHDWIRRHKPKSMYCKKCGKVTDKLDIANISGEYKRDISDFRWLCRSCHLKGDLGNG